MKKLARIVAVALLLQLLLSPQFTAVIAQDQKPAKTPAVAAGRYEAQIKLFDDFARKQMAIDHTPGLTIGFMKGDFVWVKGYGFADLENKVPAKPESAYRLASVTKSMTAFAIMQLVEQGKIELDAEVQAYVPYFPKKQWPVTVRQLLGHLGGISHYKNPEQELHFKEHKTTREAIGVFENFDLVAEPGTRYNYSSYGYNLLGAVIEGASGMSYDDYLHQHLWQPLGMNDTRMDDPVDVIPNRVRGYQLINGQVKNSEFVDISSRFAAGGTRSTVPDLLKYARGIIEGKLVSHEGMDIIATSMSTREGRLTNYGMGWDTSPETGRYMLAHSGGQQETSTLLYVLPTHDLAMAIGMNFESGNPGVYLNRLYQLITGSRPDVAFYSSDKTKAALGDAINDAFNYGLAYFEQKKQPLTTDQSELAEAFAYFNRYVNPEALKTNQQETMRKIREGVHPVAKQAFTKVGSYMAARLRETKGPARLDSYAALGGLTFFQDYLDATKDQATIPSEFRLNEAFTLVASEMAHDWSRTNTEFVRTLWLTADTDLDQLGRNLRQSFKGASIYPNLVDAFFSVARQLVLTRDQTRALKVGQLAIDLFPEAPAANVIYGITLALSGDSAHAQAPLKKAASISPNGAASAAGLNNVAYQLAGVGMVNEAVTILRTAIELYPGEANLYDSVGEFELKRGDKAKALEFYKKALEVNPNFRNAKAAREIVQKLSEPGGK